MIGLTRSVCLMLVVKTVLDKRGTIRLKFAQVR